MRRMPRILRLLRYQRGVELVFSCDEFGVCVLGWLAVSLGKKMIRCEDDVVADDDGDGQRR